MGMGIKSLKWEGIGTKNLFPHTSNVNVALTEHAVMELRHRFTARRYASAVRAMALYLSVSVRHKSVFYRNV